jgi:hypothetical protein
MAPTGLNVYTRYLIMQISSVVSGLTDLMSWGKNSEVPSPADKTAIKPAETQAQTDSGVSKVSAEIIRKYDITSISPDDFSQMLQKLYKAGALSEKDYQELSAVRADLEKQGVEPDERINLLELYSDKVSKAQKQLGTTLDEVARQRQIGPDMRRLDWLQKFAMIQANPDAVGLDVAA